jgi:hypothetical protein
VNNNGNVSFDFQNIFTYSASAFPSRRRRLSRIPHGRSFLGGCGYTQGSGTVKYKLTSNALYVNWTDVGYFSSETDKLNTFQANHK